MEEYALSCIINEVANILDYWIEGKSSVFVIDMDAHADCREAKSEKAPLRDRLWSLLILLSDMTKSFTKKRCLPLL